ncbi:hypothetical protein AcW1_001433 [Taiwanofungus camphoratus]|nr:hypothetical protein AcV5_005361 [Antrodia cinnamomea]KAI0962668.1 hypothetical protein AcV7_001462 [Antrodia cinnamomea]KAI0964665.1 hypothetical protein AcW1_001433 [Antrodia cinnamomea]
MTTTDNRKFRDVEEWYDAEAEASELLFQTWVDEGITDDPHDYTSLARSPNTVGAESGLACAGAARPAHVWWVGRGSGYAVKLSDELATHPLLTKHR